MLKKTQTEVDRWQIALNKTVLFYLMNTMNFFFPVAMLHLQIAHGATFSLFRLALYCLPAMRIPAPFLNFLFWGEPLHMHYSGKWLEYAPLQPTEVLLYMYTVRPSLAVVWSKKIGMYLPLGFFSQKKKSVKHLLPHLLTAYILPPCLALLRIFKWKCWVTRAFSIIATTNQIFIQHSIVLLHDWECKLYISMSFQKYSI